MIPTSAASSVTVCPCRSTHTWAQPAAHMSKHGYFCFDCSLDTAVKEQHTYLFGQDQDSTHLLLEHNADQMPSLRATFMSALMPRCLMSHMWLHRTVDYIDWLTEEIAEAVSLEPGQCIQRVTITAYQHRDTHTHTHEQSWSKQC